MSGCVGSAISSSGTVENMGTAVGIASLALSAQKIIFTSVFTSGSVADVGPCRQCHTSVAGVIENVTIAVEISFVVVTQA